MIEIKAPAKIILFGEHSVVYPGNKALLIPIDIFMNAKIEKGRGEEIIFEEKGDYKLRFESNVSEVLNLLEHGNQKYSRFLLDNDIVGLKTFSSNPINYAKICMGMAIMFATNKGREVQGFSIQITPSKIVSGFGSSASFACALIESILKLNEVKISRYELFELVHKAENFQHGRSSGADPAVISFGEAIVYKKPAEVRAISEGKKNISNLLSNISIFNTGKSYETTGQMVSMVAEKYNKDKSVAEIFKSINGIISEFESVFEKDRLNHERIKDLINQNGLYLEELGVVSKQVMRISKKLREEGLGVKISGGGGLDKGSGALIVYGNKIKAKYVMDGYYPRVC